MKFEKIIINDTVKYFINDKVVDEFAYTTLSTDESVNGLLFPTIKTEIKSETYPTQTYDKIECTYEVDQEITDMVNLIQELDFDEAVSVLTEYIADVELDAANVTMAETLSQLGNNLIKQSARIELEAESKNGYTQDEGYYE